MSMKVMGAEVFWTHQAWCVGALAVSATLTSCVVRTDWPRHEVSVRLERIEPFEPHDGEQLWVVFDAMELVACEDSSSAPMFSWSWISEAHAHGPTTPIRQGTPQVIDLFAQMPDSLATFSPPPGDYCALKFSMGPADADAFGLTEHNTSVVDHSIVWISESHVEPMAISTARHDRTFEFVRPWHFGVEHDVRTSLTVDVNVSEVLSAPALYDADQDAFEKGRHVLSNLPSSLDLEDPS